MSAYTSIGPCFARFCHGVRGNKATGTVCVWYVTTCSLLENYAPWWSRLSKYRSISWLKKNLRRTLCVRINENYKMADSPEYKILAYTYFVN